MFIKRGIATARFLGAFTCLAMGHAASGSSVIGQLTDAEKPSAPAFLDILSAQVEQDGGLLTFVIEARGDIPTTLAAPDDSLTYLWLVDADKNPDTGQPSPGFGSEFNVRAVISETYGGGFVDVVGSMPGGGSGGVSVQDNRIEITVGLSQINSPEDFHWRCDTFQMVGGSYQPGNGLTDIALATPLPYVPPARVTVATPLLMLSPSGPATGMLQVEVRDAGGGLLPIGDYHLNFQSSNEAVATVNTSGLVTVHSVPVQFNDTPYVEVTADGVWADNAAVIRSTTTDLGVVHQTYDGADVAFYLPASIEGVDLDQITTDYQVVEATDLAYAAQHAGVGTTPFGGGVQYLVLDVTDDSNTVPCGVSGNPVRLGWEYGKPEHNSCYIVNVSGGRVPQWGVMFHEIGHNFNGASIAFNEFVSAPSPHGGTYSEAMATLCGMWSWRHLMRCSGGLGQSALDSIDADYSRAEVGFRQALAAYQNGGANYSTLNPDILDGILFEMYDQYGLQSWYDLFSTFLPPEESLPCPIDSEAKQATWFVAAFSASSGQDLRSTFVSSYGFPVDDAAWPTLLASVQVRISERTWEPPAIGDFDCDGGVDLDDYVEFAVCLNGPGSLPDPTPPATAERCLGAFDGDDDLDVDIRDFAAFQMAFSGP